MLQVIKLISVMFLLVLSAGCELLRHGESEGVTAHNGNASELYQMAVNHAGEDNWKAALAALSSALDAGYPSPSDILTSSEFRQLRDDPVLLSSLRDVMAKHPRPSRITMVDGDEPGIPMNLEVTIMDEEDGNPVDGVEVKIVHVDNRGLYQPGDLEAGAMEWNPRLFGYCTSGAEGKVNIRTIRPAYYAPIYDAEEPAHVHFTLSRVGYRDWAGEIFFDDDDRIDSEALNAGTPIARVVTGKSGIQNVSVTLRMQRAITH